LVWKQVPDTGRQWVQQLRMPDGRVCYVGDVVRSASNDVRNVVADDWRYLRLERSSPAVYQILRRFVVETSVDCNTKLVPDPICHIQPV